MKKEKNLDLFIVQCLNDDNCLFVFYVNCSWSWYIDFKADCQDLYVHDFQKHNSKTQGHGYIFDSDFRKVISQLHFCQGAAVTVRGQTIAPP